METGKAIGKNKEPMYDKVIVPKDYQPNEMLKFEGLNTEVNYKDMVQDALYFFPNPSNTTLNYMPVPTPFNTIIPDAFTERANGTLEIIKHMDDPKLRAQQFTDEYKYYYDEEYKKILVDQAVSAMTTNIMSIIYNGTLGFIRRVYPEYQYRFIFEISHYDIQRIVLDFMDTNDLLDGTNNMGEFNMTTVLTVLGSEILREISYRLSDYIRQTIADPKFHHPTFIRRCCDQKLANIFEDMDSNSINSLVAKNCATDYMFSFGIIQDHMNEDIYRIEEVVETSLMYMIHVINEYNMA